HPDQLLGEIVEELNIRIRGAVLDRDRLTFDPAQLSKTCEEGCALRRGRFAERRHNNVYTARYLDTLLCVGRLQQTEANRENARKSDPPHQHLGWNGWRGV